MKHFFVLTFLLIPLFISAQTIIPSQLEERKESRREKGFTEWQARAIATEYFFKQKEDESYPLYLEANATYEVRGIYPDLDGSYGAASRWYLSESKLLDYHREYTGNGSILLTLSSYKNEKGETRYMAVWVSRSMLEEAERDLKRFGITQARIEL